MSKRSIGDYVRDAFFARDKASLAQIVQDAEAAVVPPILHAEPDGDEGDDKKQSIVIHNHHNPGAADAAVDDSVAGRVARLEDSVKSIDAKVSKMIDAMPPWLNKPGGDDDDDKDKEQTTDEPPPASEEAPDTEGNLEAKKLAEAEPDLMQPAGPKKTGESKMGDAAYAAHVTQGLGKLIKDTKARAEILAPGLRATIDAKPTRATQDALCGVRRAALTQASKSEAGKKALGRFDDRMIGKMSCDAVRVLFLDASDRMKDANNTAGVRDAAPVYADERSFREAQQQRIRDLNAANRAFWDKQTGRDHRDAQRH
ncbi:MAG TPA: hypothetical protein VMS92_16915 [Mycobacterium sp.]|nr:hypothetical protein [Mycobacterium sp.]